MTDRDRDDDELYTRTIVEQRSTEKTILLHSGREQLIRSRVNGHIRKRRWADEKRTCEKGKPELDSNRRCNLA
jgi:hypothetical protein